MSLPEFPVTQCDKNFIQNEPFELRLSRIMFNKCKSRKLI